MKTFYQVLVNSLIANVTNTFIWFALTFWIYLETQSVIATGVVGGIYLVATTLSGFWFGSIVDHHRKKSSMLGSSIGTLGFFVAAIIFYLLVGESAFESLTSITLWIFVVLVLGGTVVGNIRGIALPTVTTILVSEDKRDRANGLSGSVMGFAFAIASVASGFILGFFGMFWVLFISIIITIITIFHLMFVNIDEKKIVHLEGDARQTKKVDIRGTIKVISLIPGLFPLIFFTTFNNFLGGVFMALMDAYGLSLVSVQIWGAMWGLLSFGFIVGGIFIAKRGIGKNPVRTLFLVNIIMWTVSIFFTIQPSIWLLGAGLFVYMCLMPFIEAIEQTIIQKVVPQERQGRIFGFAQSIEWAASPISALAIGPLAQFLFIPYMTTGGGVELIGDWFGTGTGRGIALVFIAVGVLGLIITALAMKSKAYKTLSSTYLKGN